MTAKKPQPKKTITKNPAEDRKVFLDKMPHAEVEDAVRMLRDALTGKTRGFAVIRDEKRVLVVGRADVAAMTQMASRLVESALHLKINNLI